MRIYVLSFTTSSPLLVWLKIHLQKEIRRNMCIRICFIILQTPRIEQFYFQFCETFVDLLETSSLSFTLFTQDAFLQVYSSCHEEDMNLFSDLYQYGFLLGGQQKLNPRDICGQCSTKSTKNGHSTKMLSNVQICR